MVIDRSFRRKLFQELVERTYTANKFERKYTILAAHGRNRGAARKPWLLIDPENRQYPYIPVQELIDQFDGKSAAIVLFICNPHQREIKSSKSIVVHPRSKISMHLALRGEYSPRLYYPGIGYLEDNWRLLRRTIDSLPK